MAEEPKSPAREYPAAVTLLGTDWPGHSLPLMPGDFSKYMPHGMGFDVPPIIRPWDDPLKTLTGPNYYGFEPRSSDPIRGAPTQDPAAGVIYFDDGESWERLQIALEVIGVRLLEREYAVFEDQSENAVNERYLDQIRIIPKSALALFGAGQEASQLPTQPITIGDFIEQFLAAQRIKWNAPGYSFGGPIAGTFGGDGDWAKESLCFGFLVENAYWGIYRLWSRAWLVTK